MVTTLPLAPNPTLDPPVGAGDHAQGSGGARVTLVEYADFECPSCGEAYPLVKAVQRAFGDNLRLVFRHFPLRASHPHALAAARAAEAAAEQGRFWQMHDRLFERQHALEDDDLRRHARKLGLDLERFARALAAPGTEHRVLADLAGGTRSGVRGTPTFFINGTRYDDPLLRDPLMAALAHAALDAARPADRPERS
jgi:protein-disulfide isomerase